MDQRSDSKGGEQPNAKKNVSPSATAQSTTRIETETKTTVEAKKGIDKAVYVPPSIRRLRELSISDANHAHVASTPGQSSAGAVNVSSNEKEDESSGAQQQPQHETEENMCPRDVELASQYVRDNFPAFNELNELRLKGWSNPEGEEYFKKSKYHTDNADLFTSRNFLKMMRNVANKMQTATGFFCLSAKRPTILGFGFAPGGFIEKALEVNPTAAATGISLSDKVGGIPVLVRDQRLTTIHADITLMAGDMGMDHAQIPGDHPDAGNFLNRKIRPRAQFDLVTSEGGVLRPHVAQLGSHRDQREAHRLKASQLALALSRVKPGGRMVVLMHKAEAWNTLCLLYVFSKFANIRLFKPDQEHQFKSSFYMLATDIQSQSDEAKMAVEQWTREWKAATFGTDDEYQVEVRKNALDVDVVLEEFGQEWIRLSQHVWNLQLEGLKSKSFTQ